MSHHKHVKPCLQLGTPLKKYYKKIVTTATVRIRIKPGIKIEAIHAPNEPILAEAYPSEVNISRKTNINHKR